MRSVRLRYFIFFVYVKYLSTYLFYKQECTYQCLIGNIFSSRVQLYIIKLGLSRPDYLEEN